MKISLVRSRKAEVVSLNLLVILSVAKDLLHNIVISTGAQRNGEIYLETDFSAALHFARNDGSRELHHQ